MKQAIKQLGIGLGLVLAGLASQGRAQSSPQQVAGNGWQALTKTSPAVAVGVNQTEFAAWKGANSKYIYFSMFNGSEWTTQQVVGGGTYPNLWSAETTTAPGLTAIGGGSEYVMALVWVATKGDAIELSYWDGASWSEPVEVSGTGWTAETKKPPTVNIFTLSAPVIVWKGASSDDLWYTYNTNPGWQEQQIIGGSSWTGESNVAPALEGPATDTQAFLYWKGASSNRIWTTQMPGAGIDVTWYPQTEVSCNDPKWAAETTLSPSAGGYFPPKNPSAYDVVVWVGASTYDIWYTYDGNTGSCQWAQEQFVSGNDWTMAAQTDVAPSLAFDCGSCGNNDSTGAILAWKNAFDDTIWFINPLTLPGLSSLPGAGAKSKPRDQPKNLGALKMGNH